MSMINDYSSPLEPCGPGCVCVPPADLSFEAIPYDYVGQQGQVMLAAAEAFSSFARSLEVYTKTVKYEREMVEV